MGRLSDYNSISTFLSCNELIEQPGCFITQIFGIHADTGKLGCGQSADELVIIDTDKLLKKLSRFDVMMIDDFGYVKQDRDEMEVLFTLLAYRYERGSMLITSNLPFSKWEMIFKDPMTTAAAIDRLVHHSVVLELNVPSYRAEQAMKRKNKDK